MVRRKRSSASPVRRRLGQVPSRSAAAHRAASTSAALSFGFVVSWPWTLLALQVRPRPRRPREFRIWDLRRGLPADLQKPARDLPRKLPELEHHFPAGGTEYGKIKEELRPVREALLHKI